jgi:hypothetical protein
LSQTKLSRRDLLKALAAATGATIISTIPNKWVTPIIEIGALPAHAQASQLGSIQVTITVQAFRPNRSKPAPSCSPTWKVRVHNSSVDTTVDVSDTPSNPWNVIISNLPAGTYTVDLIDHCACGFADAVFDTQSGVVVTPPGQTQVNFFNEACVQ